MKDIMFLGVGKYPQVHGWPRVPARHAEPGTSLPSPAPWSREEMRPAGGSACIPLSTRRPRGKPAPAPAPPQVKRNPLVREQYPSPTSLKTQGGGEEGSSAGTPGGLCLPARKAKEKPPPRSRAQETPPEQSSRPTLSLARNETLFSCRVPGEGERKLVIPLRWQRNTVSPGLHPSPGL